MGAINGILMGVYAVVNGDHTGLVARKPVFGVSDKASFKSVSSATETS